MLFVCRSKFDQLKTQKCSEVTYDRNNATDDMNNKWNDQYPERSPYR